MLCGDVAGEAKAAVPVQRLAIKVMGPTCGPALAFEPPQVRFQHFS